MPKLDEMIRSLQRHNKAGRNDLLAMTRASEQASKALIQLEIELFLASELKEKGCDQVLNECKKLRQELSALPERILGSAKCKRSVLYIFRPTNIKTSHVSGIC